MRDDALSLSHHYQRLYNSLMNLDEQIKDDLNLDDDFNFLNLAYGMKGISDYYK